MWITGRGAGILVRNKTILEGGVFGETAIVLKISSLSPTAIIPRHPRNILFAGNFMTNGRRWLVSVRKGMVHSMPFICICLKAHSVCRHVALIWLDALLQKAPWFGGRWGRQQEQVSACKTIFLLIVKISFPQQNLSQRPKPTALKPGRLPS